ncbi:MAG: T9SS type A sorting domain-containing protein [Bacteroidota bacterium]
MKQFYISLSVLIFFFITTIHAREANLNRSPLSHKKPAVTSAELVNYHLQKIKSAASQETSNLQQTQKSLTFGWKLDHISVKNQWGANLVDISQQDLIYNAQGQLAEVIVQVSPCWCVNTAWKNNARYVYSYNANGFLDSSTYIIWAFDSVWQNYNLETFTYDANNRIVEDANYTWGGYWDPYYKDITTYLANDSINYTIRQAGPGSFSNQSKDDYTYNGSGFLTQLKLQSWSGGAWADVTRHIYTNNAAGHRLTDTEDNYTSGVWKRFKEYTYTYNAGEQLILETDQVDSSGVLLDNGIFTFGYDAAGNSNYYLEQNCFWNACHDVTQNFSTYNANNSIADYLAQLSNSSGGWDNANHSTYIYDVNGNILNLQQQECYTSGGPWDDTYLYAYTWSASTGIQNTGSGNSSLNNYPNPFNDITHINFSLPSSGNVQLMIYDISGQLITSFDYSDLHAGKQEIIFDATKLSAGSYLYIINSGTYSEERKMIVIR